MYISLKTFSIIGIEYDRILAERYYSLDSLEAYVILVNGEYEFKINFTLNKLFDVLRQFEIGRDELLTHSKEEIREIGLIQSQEDLIKYSEEYQKRIRRRAKQTVTEQEDYNRKAYRKMVVEALFSRKANI